MRAIILAGGRGSRFGDMTKEIPKPLIKVAGKSLIYHVLDALPGEIEECIIVVGYLGEIIQQKLGMKYGRFSLVYVKQLVGGTGGALKAVEKLLCPHEMFLVVGSDDIFGADQLSHLLIGQPSYGVFFGKPIKPVTHQVTFDSRDVFIGLRSVPDDFSLRFYGVGAYVLPYSFFSGKLYQLSNGEFSIPHSLENMPFRVKVVRISQWLPVNNLEEKIIAEEALFKIEPTISV